MSNIAFKSLLYREQHYTFADFTITNANEYNVNQKQRIF